MTKSSDPKRHWRRLHEWPETYRALWDAATAPSDDLDGPSYGRSLRPASLATLSRNFGRWINFLECRGELDERLPPSALVTPARIADYLRELTALGYNPQTITLAISAISCTMRIFAPEQDWRWIWKPKGVKLGPYLKSRRKEFPVPKPSELFQWGLELMTNVDDMPWARDRLEQYRDGLMICLLAARPLRRNSFAAMRLGEHLFRSETGWRLKFQPDEIKNRRWIEVSVPNSLEPWIERYLAEIRPAMLPRKGKGTNEHGVRLAQTALWLSSDGTMLTPERLTAAIWKRSSRRFSKPFGPHRFRHAAGTYAPTEDPDHPGIATSLLAIGAQMHAKHYNRAKDHVATEKFHAALADEREKAISLARRLIAERGNAEA